MGTVSKVLEQINQYVWGLPTLLLLVSTGIILTVRLKGLQFSKLFQIKKAIDNSYYFWKNNLQKR
ncbi:hypothetical protein IEE_02217 [Bacillus cereus BAG5X1-1]|uniref:Sodium:alanine symporter family protein n=1 Tax=Bacillus cereus BAG5X1-1 TaxID=1053189 RepID=J8B472_BACCE|nr:hypothetical protein IEE_02217 [Bacillus cereus BAG5X1-1]